jgi:hypothetical protein
MNSRRILYFALFPMTLKDMSSFEQTAPGRSGSLDTDARAEDKVPRVWGVHYHGA